MGLINLVFVVDNSNHIFYSNNVITKSVLRSGLLDVLQLGHLNFDDPKLINRTRKGLS